MTSRNKIKNNAPEDADLASFHKDMQEIDMALVWEEILVAEAENKTFAADDLDCFGLRGDRYPELSADAQALLVKEYQRSMRLRKALKENSIPVGSEKEAKRIIEKSELYTEYLVGAVFRLVRKIVGEKLTGRYGEAWGSSLKRDMLSDSYATVLEAATLYDDTKGPSFSSWVAAKVNYNLIPAMEKHSANGSMPESWRRLMKIMAHGIPELEDELKRQATMDEIKKMATLKCYKRTEEGLTDEQKELPAEQRKALVTDKLTKSGLLKGLRELPEIKAAMETSSWFDNGQDELDALTNVSNGENPEDGVMHDIVSSEYEQLLNIGMGSLTKEKKEMVLAYLTQGDEKQTYKKVAKDYGFSDLELKRMVRDTRARLQAPHAQYAYLGEEAVSQFETDEDDTLLGALHRKNRVKMTRFDKELFLSKRPHLHIVKDAS